MGERLTWEQIKAKYPHRYVALVNIEWNERKNGIITAEVKCTDLDKSYEELMWMYIVTKEAEVRYTTPDEDDHLGGLVLDIEGVFEGL